MSASLEQQIEAAHLAAERIEAEARQLEARILATGARLPTRQYGRPVDAGELRRNLTATALINQRDPALASFLGLQDGSHQRRQQQAAERQQQIQRLQAATDEARTRNLMAAQRRQAAFSAGINPVSGRRLGV